MHWQGWAAGGRQQSRECAHACGGRESWVGVVLPSGGVRLRTRVPNMQRYTEHVASAEVGGVRDAGFGSRACWDIDEGFNCNTAVL